MKRAQAIILRAGDTRPNGSVISAEALRAVAEKNNGLFTYHSRTLYAWVDLDDRSQVTNAHRQAMTYLAQVMDGE